MIRKALWTIFATWAAVLSEQAAAQADYPIRAIRLVVPFAPGGSADLVARVLAQKLGEQMPAGMLVENRAGANMNIGADYVAKASPDGYTVLYNTSNMIFNISMYATLPYDVFRDFAPITLTAAVPRYWWSIRPYQLLTYSNLWHISVPRTEKRTTPLSAWAPFRTSQRSCF